MPQDALIDHFINFGLTAAIGFLIGLERSMSARENPHGGLRDFMIFALIGALSAFVAVLFDNAWLIGVGFFGLMALLLLAYWGERKSGHMDKGITTEASAIVTFFLGVLTMQGMHALAVALAIAMIVVLSQKQTINRFSAEIKTFELDATLKFLVITFIVLPILPHKSVDNLLTYSIGQAAFQEQTAGQVAFVPGEGQVFEAGSSLHLYDDSRYLGQLRIESATEERVVGRIDGEAGELANGTPLYSALAPMFIMHMLAALNPFKVWLIVVLVSFISFVGYVLVKILGAGAGVGLTGLIGGLASSTVTTLSFSKRSKELPAWNQIFAVAILLASSIMFPRLLLQIGVFNPELMRNMALPILVTGGTGLVIAGFMLLRNRKTEQDAGEASQEVSFDNPFCLKSAIVFGCVFATILMVTRLAITYLGSSWLPVVSIVSGLTDADAIAFSVSDAERAGLISLDWASFNVVLGALANTFMKLFLVFSLGDRGLFKRLLLAFLIMGAAGIISMLLYYDLSAMG